MMKRPEESTHLQADAPTLGANFRDRERIKRQQERWKKRLDRMPPAERAAMLKVLNGTADARPRAKSSDGDRLARLLAWLKTKPLHFFKVKAPTPTPSPESPIEPRSTGANGVTRRRSTSAASRRRSPATHPGENHAP